MSDEKKLYLLKLGEISLKGLNRHVFEKKLALNIKDKLRPLSTVITGRKGRLFLETDSMAEDDNVFKALGTTFGIDGYAKALVCQKDIAYIRETAAAALKSSVSFVDDGGSFKVSAKREDKQFSLNSYQIECDLADVVFSLFPSLHVDVKDPDRILYVEIRDKAYVYTSSVRALSGLPVGTAGKALCMLSGGIDSPVAAFKMASRGLRQELVYFHAYPYTGDEARGKVTKLASLIAPYLGGTILHIINFTPMEKLIMKSVAEREKTVILRAAMMRVAKKLAVRRRCDALVTGEALSQVASQTLDAMKFTTSMADFLVLRPLVGMDKAEIIDTAKRIGTYETSILPFADCCSLFSPRHPVTNPKIDEESRSYESMDAEATENEAVETAETVFFSPMGIRRKTLNSN